MFSAAACGAARRRRCLGRPHRTAGPALKTNEPRCRATARPPSARATRRYSPLAWCVGLPARHRRLDSSAGVVAERGGCVVAVFPAVLGKAPCPGHQTRQPRAPTPTPPAPHPAATAGPPQTAAAAQHCESNFPARKARSSLDVGLPDGAGDDAYLRAVSGVLPGVLEEFRPDLVLYDAGGGGGCGGRGAWTLGVLGLPLGFI
jgi:hypothetical protein